MVVHGVRYWICTQAQTLKTNASARAFVRLRRVFLFSMKNIFPLWLFSFHFTPIASDITYNVIFLFPFCFTRLCFWKTINDVMLSAAGSWNVCYAWHADLHSVGHYPLLWINGARKVVFPYTNAEYPSKAKKNTKLKREKSELNALYQTFLSELFTYDNFLLFTIAFCCCYLHLKIHWHLQPISQYQLKILSNESASTWA